MIGELSEKVNQIVSQKCEDYEIYISREKTINLDCEKTVLNFAKEEIVCGVGIRVLKDTK